MPENVPVMHFIKIISIWPNLYTYIYVRSFIINLILDNFENYFLLNSFPRVKAFTRKKIIHVYYAKLPSNDDNFIQI